MSRMSRKDAENQVRSWGFSHVFTWTDSPDYHYNPHKHSGVTTHLILSGELTISYPEDNPDENLKETLGPGARFDVPAGKMHEVWVGKEGCTYVIGE
ncbi:uncharacterized protein C8Q71DRAFT_783627 [Rhodofomes roseus]|uniref:Cupin n=1 Tax=Rhodofomes roseus TaxID=34475 RepID=A0ABQ8K2F8_9APHY|nr:uncharacterized protein C8Q71DRAFT_783627 [Rhodofomes roseus]KAH9830897.1 hypothetical protein C8Q71DRAFT_783627 [Rhodofomes roseus]